MGLTEQRNGLWIQIRARFPALLILALLAVPSSFADFRVNPSGSDDVPVQTRQAEERNNDELLKNFMASMTYTPEAVALPEDPVIYPSLSMINPESGMSGLIHGSDSDMDLPVPEDLEPKRPVKVPKKLKLLFSKPVLNAVISSPFGWRWGRMHQGVDLAVGQGTPILATEAGKVTYSGWLGGYGNLVSIDHGGGFVSRYGHASVLLVRAGQKIKKGQIIALVGSTGHSTGPHLHFELVSNGKHRNPLAMINKTIQLSAQ